jgi:hypothetical protein
MKELLIDLSKVVGAFTVLVGAWVALGGWMPASSQQLATVEKHLELHLAQTDIQVYQQNVDRLILQGGQIDRELKSSSTPSPFLDDQQRVNAEELATAKSQLHDAQQKAIDLSK